MATAAEDTCLVISIFFILQIQYGLPKADPFGIVLLSRTPAS